MNVAVFGANGRVGSKVVEIATKRGHKVIPIDIKSDKFNDKTVLAATFAEQRSISVMTTKVEALADVKKVEKIDVVIDFSTAAATQDVCDFCAKHHCALVSGVTGRNEQQQQLIDDLSGQLPVVCKANFSQGVDMLHRICEIVARELPDWDCEIVEIHRKGKLDAPSGTAKSLAATVAQQKSFKRVTTHALRVGSNFGKHEVIFATNGESLTLTHQAENVDIFALGAIIQAESLRRL